MQASPRVRPVLLVATLGWLGIGCGPDDAGSDGPGSGSGSGAGADGSSEAEAGLESTAAASTSGADGACSSGEGDDSTGGDATSAASTSDASTSDASTSDASTSDASTSDASTSSDATTGEPDEIAPAPARWVRTMNGLLSLGNEHPRIAARPDGSVLYLASGGLYGRVITLGQGEPGEVALPVFFVGIALGVLDGSTGLLQHARLVADGLSDPLYGGRAFADTLVVDADGTALVSGTMMSSVRLHPGTPAARTATAPIRLVGDTLHRAEDPFFARFEPETGAGWLHFGRTPGPLQTTWFNDARGIAALPDGGALVAGDYELSGFTVGSGLPGATTLSGSQSSYFARLDATGSPVWVGRNTGQLNAIFSAVRTDASGAMFALAHGGQTLFDGHPSEFTFDNGPDSTYALVRIDPDGGIEWARRIAFADGFPNGLNGFEVADDGRILVTGALENEVIVESDGETLATVTVAESQAIALAFDPDGTLAWSATAGPGSSLPATTWTDAGAVMVASFSPSTTEVVVVGVPTPLPTVDVEPISGTTVALGFDETGAVVHASVVGIDLPVSDVSPGPDGALLLTGPYRCDEPPSVFDGDTLVELPSGCAVGFSDQRGYALSIDGA